MSFKLNERGFATLEVILMITVIGILSAIAIPSFTTITTSANTAKIQADLSTIDTAIAIYQMDNGSLPGSMADLSSYIQDIDNLKPPKGKYYYTDKNDSTTTEETAPDKYDIKNGRATISDHTSNQIRKNTSSS